MDIDKIFTYHTADDVAVEHFQEIRDAAKVLGYCIMNKPGARADKERAILKLRECVFYAIASLAIPHEDSEK